MHVVVVDVVVVVVVVVVEVVVVVVVEEVVELEGAVVDMLMVFEVVVTLLRTGFIARKRKRKQQVKSARMLLPGNRMVTNLQKYNLLFYSLSIEQILSRGVLEIASDSDR